MAKTDIPPLPQGRWLNSDLTPTTAYRAVLSAIINRIGGTTDKVDAASTTANAAAPGDAEVVAGLGLQFGGQIGGNAAVSLYRVRDLVANLPATGNQIGDWAYATNARNSGEGAAAGTGAPVVWSGSAWRIPGNASAVVA